MYTEADYTEAKKRSNLVYLALAAFTVAMGVIIALCFAARMFFPTFMLTVVWWFGVVLYYGTRGVYIVRYKKHLDEALHSGLRRICEGIVQEKRGPFWFDNLEVIEYVLLRDDGFERKLYYDALLPEPAWEAGGRACCETFGSFITAIKPTDGM